MLTANRVLSVAKKGTGPTMRAIVTFITVGTLLVGLLAALVKSIWFRVDYGHVAVMMRNQRIKLDKKTGQVIIKEPGWRSQFPVRDDSKAVNCMLQTSELKAQDLTAGDGKNNVNATLRWFVLSLRNGEQYRYHPARTLLVDNLNQEVEELCRDAIREVMANSETPACQWRSDELTQAVKQLVKKKLKDIGVRLEMVRLPEAALSEAQLHGNKVLDGFKILSGQSILQPVPDEETSEEYGSYPGPHAVPS